MKKYVLCVLLYATSLFAMPSFVDVEYLQQHYNDKNLVIIDVRDAKSYKKGHLKRAVNLPASTYLFDTKHQYMMPKLDFLAKAFSNAGINKESKVVVYGNNELIWGARFYWLARVLGHNEVGLLKVGYGKWKSNALPTTTKIYKPTPTHFIPRINNKIIATKLSTMMAINKESILDGRPFAFYKGEKSHAKRYGHIPSALNYPGKDNYDLNGSGMKSFSQLKSLYKNLPKNKRVILYCEDGADAALNFMVLQEMGYNASVYDGSWLEWGNDSNLPIAK